MSDSRSCKPGNSSSHVDLVGDGEDITLTSSDILDNVTKRTTREYTTRIHKLSVSI